MHKFLVHRQGVDVVPGGQGDSADGLVPDPAVSVPSAKLTRPLPTKAPEPEEEPPGTNLSSKAFLAVPNGERVPTNPAANWSMLVFPTMIPPAVQAEVIFGGPMVLLGSKE